MIRYANADDLPLLEQYDRHISEDELRDKIRDGRVLVMFRDGVFIGWLRFGLFWDNIPFMNMLYFLEEYRRQGNGREIVAFWEREMRAKGYKFVLTSTQSDETAQFFYRKTGYTECGALTLPGEPLEIFFIKKLI